MKRADRGGEAKVPGGAHMTWRHLAWSVKSRPGPSGLGPSWQEGPPPGELASPSSASLLFGRSRFIFFSGFFWWGRGERKGAVSKESVKFTGLACQAT